MLNNHRDKSRPSRVTVAYEDGALSFMLSKDATFEDLADRLGRLGGRHHGKPVAIEIKLAAAFDPGEPDPSRTWLRSRRRRRCSEKHALIQR
jgi:hypothetical protein